MFVFYFQCFTFLSHAGGVSLMYNVVLVSGGPPSGSVLHIHISPLLQTLLPHRLLQTIGQSSLCYLVAPC